jgi:plasminogen activator inhibitor 1 RNA-binding protein
MISGWSSDSESGEAVTKEDDEAKEMTLDEWKALQDQKRMKATFNIRKAGEGVDNAQFKKGVAYTKKKESEDEEDEESDEDEVFIV